MLIRRMSAVFGKLQGDTLELQDGFNIIQAPNESGKSTWCAFLLSMLYGVNSRERDRAGMPADKNRYAPWNGSPMSGRLDLRADGREITLLRTTRRPNVPMGEFQALYTDTGDAVPGLTGTLCGEQLLGITREVYGRSGFIRQNGLGISQSAELERRIAALISGGEETASCSEAAEALKKQLNRRRHNKTGQIPALEAELDQLRRQLAEAELLTGEISRLRQQERQLARQEGDLQRELALHSRWEEQQRSYRLSEASVAADEALRRADAVRRQLEADNIPESETIARLRGAIVNTNTSHHALEKARLQRDEALKALLQAEAAANRSPFAGQTAEQAEAFASETARPAISQKSAALWIILGAAGILAGILLIFSVIPSFPGIPSLAAGLAAAAAGLAAMLVPLCRRHRRRKALQVILKRHNVPDIFSLQALAAEYAQLLAQRDEAQAEADQRAAAADTLYQTIFANEQALLLEIRRFAPLAHDLSTADVLLRGCAIRRKELAAAEDAAREAMLRQEESLREAKAEAAQFPHPQRLRREAEAELSQVSAALQRCQSSIQHMTGQLSAFGDAPQLAAEAEAAAQQLEFLQQEYDALQLALEALSNANQTLQNRFAPALGRRTAELFRRLTADRYQNVVLDRSLRLSAEPAEDLLYRDVGLLSAGAADQLYLAARLAICESILPADRKVPIILDDALANFDDARCADALELLRELARDRQILLFTCHSREAAFLADAKEVSVHRLTNCEKRV